MESQMNSGASSKKETLVLLAGDETQLSASVLLCRLCAHGQWSGGPAGGSESTDEMKWLHLQKTCGGSSDTIQAIIGKLVPKSILTSVPEDKTPVICLACYESLLDLTSFFDKISKGQEKLKKVLAELRPTSNNIQIPVPRKRGRPRKGTTSTLKPDTTNIVLQEESIAKRPSRISTRYTEATPPKIAVSPSQVPQNVENESDAAIKSQHDAPTHGLSLNHDKTENRNLEKRDTDNLKITDAEDDDDVGNAAQSDSDVSIKSIHLTGGKKPIKKRKRGRPRKIKKELQFKCDKCEKSYFHHSSLVYHKLSSHEKLELQCTVCQSTFKHRALLTNHMFTHDTEAKVNVNRRCDVPGCNSSFKTRSGLSKHKRRAHFISDNGFTCDVCGIQVTSKSSLKAHSRIHTGERPFSCQYCDKAFNHKGNLKEHLRSHTHEKPYLCTEPNCQKGFATSSQLRNHKLTHSKTKLFLCPECGKGFNTLISMKVHARRHDGIAIEECNICHKKFSDQWSLTKHRRLHTRERPYECKVCRKTFSDPSNFTKHKKIHPDPSNARGRKEQSSKVSITAAVGSFRGNDADLQGFTQGDKNNVDCERETEAYPLDVIINEEGTGDNIVSTSESLVQILNPDQLAAMSKEGAATGHENVMYLYQSTDGFSVSVMDHQHVEVTAEDDNSAAVSLNKTANIEKTSGTLSVISENDSMEQGSQVDNQD